MTKKLTSTRPMRCPDHGRVTAELRRTQQTEGGIVVDDVAAYVCPQCAKTLAVPHQAAGRIAAALQQQTATSTKEVRVPQGLEDLALAVNAQLGTAGVGETFTLPLHLGLQLAGSRTGPPDEWRAFDDDPKTVRARPRVHAQTMARLEGLACAWEATVADVVRWLVVAAYDAVTAGLTAAPVEEPGTVFATISSVETHARVAETKVGASLPAGGVAAGAFLDEAA